MENQRNKTYEKFAEEIKDRNFILLANQIIEQLDRYSGREVHNARTLKKMLSNWININRKEAKGVNLEGTIGELLSSLPDEWFGEWLIGKMYDLWKGGAYLI